MSDDLATWLRNEAESRGWSYHEISKRSGISFQSIALYADGRSNPRPSSCRKLARAFGVTYEEIMRLASHLPPEPEIKYLEITDAQIKALNLAREIEGKKPLARSEVIGYSLPLDEEIEEFLKEYPQLRPAIEDKRKRFDEQSMRALLRLTRFFIAHPEEHAAFGKSLRSSGVLRGDAWEKSG